MRTKTKKSKDMGVAIVIIVVLIFVAGIFIGLLIQPYIKESPTRVNVPFTPSVEGFTEVVPNI